LWHFSDSLPTASIAAARGMRLSGAIGPPYARIMEDRTPKRRNPPPAPATAEETPPPEPPREIGGPKGPEPTRYGDWEYNGRCTDF
jgi:hypothetical protein